MSTEEEKIEDLEYRLSCLLDHATGGILSKPNYKKEDMYDAVDDYIVRMSEKGFDVYKAKIKELESKLEIATHGLRYSQEVIHDEFCGAEHHDFCLHVIEALKKIKEGV